MARWKELPTGLGERERQLLVQLRRLKDHSGLSLAALAGRTGYSRSSWERYLNGKQPVPRRAVEELARVCGSDATRLVVLHEVAVGDRLGAPATPPGPRREPDAPDAAGAGPAGSRGPGTAAGSPGSGPGPARETAPTGLDSVAAAEAGQEAAGDVVPPDEASGNGPGGRWTRRPLPLGRVLVSAALAVAVAFVAGLLVAGAWRDEGSGATDPSATGYRRGQTYACQVRREDGELRAGHSPTREMLLDINSTGFDVVETQCLLREHGIDPGAADGLYSEGTKEAVTRFQKERRLVVDGIVGPDTWRELRR
ncbi:peptidoglycan-binding protein [Streptomyces sp. LP05-1]|uniref:Peptidoglycan-binding protein n=1 Tax=Streptomyces pyxinae TaxID=2970734 RepID=A0ABT2CBI7_9ACTN|nr:helix-turn-helix domain-containing protein [Streptomyces sp. LP05-1]MCS0634731.1 peptidoglycan-binding protein [Streptomyces sp. LP05-1]